MSHLLFCASHLAKSFGPTSILNDVGFSLKCRERLFLIGENGSGKTTLIRILLGEILPDSGTITQKSGLTIGYLPQAIDNQPIQGSFGEERKRQIARLADENPELLILDEPTNHLDEKGLLWLERLLKCYRGALLVISHDRTFMNNMADAIVELEGGKLTRFGGNYDFYLQEKQKILSKALRAYSEQKEEIKHLKRTILQKTHNTPKPSHAKDSNAMAYNSHGQRKMLAESKSIRQAKSKLEDVLQNPLSNPIPKGVHGIHFRPHTLFGDVAIRIQSLSKSYGKKALFSDFSFDLYPGERAVIQGANGSGKSTLLQIIANIVAPDSGSVVIAPGVRLGFLEQEPTITGYVFDLLACDTQEATRELHMMGLPLQNMNVASYSLGQKRRLQLLLLQRLGANVLLLDEPTNHLDLVTTEQLEHELIQFNGAILAVTHDRRFINNVATRVEFFGRKFGDD